MPEEEETEKLSRNWGGRSGLPSSCATILPAADECLTGKGWGPSAPRVDPSRKQLLHPAHSSTLLSLINTALTPPPCAPPCSHTSTLRHHTQEPATTFSFHQHHLLRCYGDRDPTQPPALSSNVNIAFIQSHLPKYIWQKKRNNNINHYQYSKDVHRNN